MMDIRGSVRRYGPLVAVAALLVTTGVVGATLVGSGDTAPPSGEEILNATEQRYERAETVVGTATVLAVNSTEEYAATVEYVAAEGNRSRVTVSANGSTVVAGTNETHAWVYDPATGIARVTSEAELEARAEAYREANPDRFDSYEDLRERLKSNVTVSRVGTETVRGETAWVLAVDSTNESVTTTGRLWVARADSTVLRARLTGANGTVTVDFRDTRFGVAVDNSTFRAPGDGGRNVAGAERTTYDSLGAAQAATNLTVPDLRDSYELSRVVVAEFDGTTTATAAYETQNGTAYVAVTTADRAPEDADADTATVAGREVTVAQARGGTAVYWTDEGVTTAVLLRGPEESALAVAGAVLA